MDEQLSTLTDEEIICRLKELASRERACLRPFLRHLQEFDSRKVAERRAYPSTFIYCVRELALSEGETYRRIQAARISERFPVILDYLEHGRVTLSVVGVLAPHLNKSNALKLLDDAVGKSKRDVEFMIAAIAPKHEPRDSIRSVDRTPSAAGADHPLPEPSAAPIQAGSILAQPVTPQTPSREVLAPPRDYVEPLTARSVRIAFTAKRALLQKLEKAQGLLRHKHPSGALEAVIEEAVDFWLAQRDPDRKVRPAATRDVIPNRRRIPQGVKDEVWRRDEGRCAYVSRDGRRCEQTSWLEFDHVVPFNAGGRSDTETNIRLLCRAHNQVAAKQWEFGRGNSG